MKIFRYYIRLLFGIVGQAIIVTHIVVIGRLVSFAKSQNWICIKRSICRIFWTIKYSQQEESSVSLILGNRKSILQ
jgi:hypothetical protein